MSVPSEPFDATNASPLAHTTPFPNLLLDEALPRLKDTEWRVLCVIVRQTIGWIAGAGTSNRKQRDWLTREQLKARTGRDSEAIARAVDALVQKNIIVAETQAGVPLLTPDERRRHRARVYYALAPHLRPQARLPVSLSPSLSPKSEHGTRAMCSLLPGIHPQSEHDSAAKANRTKEKHTKETLTKETVTKILSFPEKRTCGFHGQPLPLEAMAVEAMARQVFKETPNPFHGEVIQEALRKTSGSDAGRQAPLPIVEPPAEGEQPELLSPQAQAFAGLFRAIARGELGKAADIHLLPEDRTRLEGLIDKHQGLEWKPVLELFFESDLGYLTRRGHSLPSFLHSCNFFLIRMPGAFPATTPGARRSGWRKPFD